MTLHPPVDALTLRLGTSVGGVGSAAARPDVPPKVEGRFAFANDLVAPDMVFAATVRSLHAHAHVTRVDAAPALARPGVLAVLTVDDVPGAHRIGHIVSDQPVLVDGTVRYEGEPIAVVVAATQRRPGRRRWPSASVTNRCLCSPIPSAPWRAGSAAPCGREPLPELAPASG